MILFDRFFFILYLTIVISLFIVSVKLFINIQKKDPWKHFHKIIIDETEEKFKNGHYPDVVTTIFQEISTLIKKIYHIKTSKELNGTNLMHNAFNEDRPIIYLADLSTLIGKDCQKGYRFIFAGCNLAIRNVFTHKKVNINEEEALRYLYIADHILNKLDEAQIECNCGSKTDFFYFLENQKCINCKKKENPNL